MECKKLPLEPALAFLVIDQYEGEKEGEIFHGKGWATFKNGNIYKGDFFQGRMHGYGKYTWLDGTIYEGHFESNELLGKGKYIWPDQSIYEGDIVNGLREGNGIFQSGTSAAKYEGEWRKGHRDGEGIFIYDSSQQVRYEGEWKEGKRNGNGIMIYPSGNIYEGEWKMDMKDGKGKMNWYTLNESYEGEWKHDLQDGMGHHIWYPEKEIDMFHQHKLLCNRYEGMFQQGQRHGYGNFYYANGAKYTGEWKLNSKHGYGVFLFEDGNIYQGTFENDKMMNNNAMNNSSTTNASSTTSPKHSNSPKKNPMVVFDKQSSGLHFYLSDLFISMASSKEMKLQMKKEIENSVLLLNTELKSIYKYYSVLNMENSHSSSSNETNPLKYNPNYAMDHLDLWCFLRDCQLLTPYTSFTLRQIQHIFQSIDKQQKKEIFQKFPFNSKGELKEVSYCQLCENLNLFIHVPSNSHPILFREFVELCVRMAYQFYLQDEISIASLTSTNQSKIFSFSSIFTSFYTSKIMHQACPQARNEMDYLSQYISIDVQTIVQKHHHVLQSIYNSFIDQENKKKMTKRQFISFVEKNSFFSLTDFSISKVLKCLSIYPSYSLSILPIPIEDGKKESIEMDNIKGKEEENMNWECLEEEILLEEFELGLLQIADYVVDRILPLHIKMDQFIKDKIMKIFHHLKKE